LPWCMVCLVVGLDRRTLSPWHTNVRARDVASAKLVARARARRLGIDLIVAATIGPSGVVRDPADEPGPHANAA
jgi:hypothetical protein